MTLVYDGLGCIGVRQVLWQLCKTRESLIATHGISS